MEKIILKRKIPEWKKTKMKVKCSKCNYEWNSKSKLIWITCPSCMVKIRNPAIKKGNK